MKETEVTIIQEDGKHYGYMFWRGLEVKEEIDPMVFEMTEQKQKYWFRKNIVSLERKMKALRVDYPLGARHWNERTIEVT